MTGAVQELRWVPYARIARIIYCVAVTWQVMGLLSTRRGSNLYCVDYSLRKRAPTGVAGRDFRSAAEPGERRGPSYVAQQTSIAQWCSC